MSYQGKTLLIDGSYSITGTNWEKKCVPSVLSYVDYLSYIFTPDNVLKGILGSERGRSSLLPSGFAAHGPSLAMQYTRILINLSDFRGECNQPL